MKSIWSFNFITIGKTTSIFLSLLSCWYSSVAFIFHIENNLMKINNELWLCHRSDLLFIQKSVICNISWCVDFIRSDVRIAMHWRFTYDSFYLKFHEWTNVQSAMDVHLGSVHKCRAYLFELSWAVTLQFHSHIFKWNVLRHKVSETIMVCVMMTVGRQHICILYFALVASVHVLLATL